MTQIEKLTDWGLDEGNSCVCRRWLFLFLCICTACLTTFTQPVMMMMSHLCWAVPQCVPTVINLPLRQVLHNILLLDQRFFSWKEFRCNGHMSYCTLARFGHRTCFISLPLSLPLCHFTSMNCSSLLSYQTILPLLSCRSKIMGSHSDHCISALCKFTADWLHFIPLQKKKKKSLSQFPLGT